MNLEKRIESFSVLGTILRDSLGGNDEKSGRRLSSVINRQSNINGWFTAENVRFALEAIANELTAENLKKWTEPYPALNEVSAPSKVGLIFAGNIPLAGFHDFLSVLISGNKVLAKTSSKDPELIPYIAEILYDIDPEFRELIEFTSGTMNGFDSIIATGSNNSSRYFEYYFGQYPNIIRKNRNSIAIIDGCETDQELESLGKDIFTYFGLGCRNVSKIYIPVGYDLVALASHWDKAYSDVVNHSKYANNYDYNKAIYMVNRQKFHDTGYMLLREDSKLSSPVSVLHYEYYRSAVALEEQTTLLNDRIQCIISRVNIPFGHSQTPHLWDYADGTDTLEFLLKKNLAGIL
jgi:hypothetical protein